MLDKTKKHNRIKVLRGKLQKMAVQYRAFTNSSSFVGNMRYDQDEQSMTGILSGKHYKWCGVPESKFDSFQGAGSAGAFFNRDIKGQYDCSSMGKLNQVKSRISQLQKMAIDYKTNWKTHGADMDAIRAFKSKEVYSSGENHPSGSKFKFRTDGKSLFLHDYEVAKHHKDGIEISNAGYDSPLTYKTHQALGINSKGHAKHPKGLITLGTKEIDKNSGEWVLVKHSDISEEPIIPDTMRKNQKARADGTFVERKKPKRETAEQASFRKRATKKELKEQGRKGGKPLSKVNIQKTDQRIIDAISGLKKSLPTDKRGQAAHHLLEYSGDGDIGKKLGLNKKDNDDENNSIMLPHDYHDFISHYNTSNPKTNLDNLRQMDSKIKQLQGKLQKIATVNKNALGNNTMEKIGSYDWHTGEELSLNQIHALGNGNDVFAVAVTKGLNKNSDFRVPEEYINKDFGVKKIGLVKGIYENEEGLIEHDRTYLFHGSDDEVQRQLNLHNDINKGVSQEAAGRIYKDKDGIVQYENIPNKQFKKTK
jgi:hypothetical protein